MQRYGNLPANKNYAFFGLCHQQHAAVTTVFYLGDNSFMETNGCRSWCQVTLGVPSVSDFRIWFFPSIILNCSPTKTHMAPHNRPREKEIRNRDLIHHHDPFTLFPGQLFRGKTLAAKGVGPWSSHESDPPVFYQDYHTYF